jgi:hypothetical protein
MLQRNRFLTHVLLLLLILGLGAFLLFRRDRLRRPPPSSPVAGQETPNPVARPGAAPASDPGTRPSPLPPSPATEPPSVPEAPRAPGKLTVHLEQSPPGPPDDLTVLVLAKATGAIEAKRDLRRESTTEFDPIPSGTKVIVVLPHGASVGPAYVESFVAPAASTDAIVALSAGKGLEGIVVDLQGRPIEKAEVMADLRLGYQIPREMTGVSDAYMNISSDGTSWSFFAVLGMVGRTVLTDADGRFRIGNTGTRSLEVSAKAGAAKSLMQTVLPGTPVRLVVQR